VFSFLFFFRFEWRFIGPPGCCICLTPTNWKPLKNLKAPDESFFKRSRKVIVVLTVKEILDEEIARKLA
jgi:hypothetical protein